MNIRFYNARLLTMTNGLEILKAELWVENNIITHIGDDKKSDVKWDREIDVNNNLLIPGFKNAHTHSAMTFLRSYADDLPLLQWLEKQVFPMEKKLTEEHVYCFAKLAIMEYLTSGITSNFDMYFHPKAVAQATMDTGFRTVMVGSITDDLPVEELERDYLHYNALHHRLSYKLGFHAQYTSSLEQMEEISELAHKYKSPVFTHNSESVTEVEACVAEYGMSPTQLMDKIGMFTYGGGGYHCVQLSHKDMEIFRDRGLWVITNPGSNTKLASGIAPIVAMDNMGIQLALGTDGPASNNCLDMFREMFLVTGLAKLREKDAAALSAEKVLTMATTGGAHAMGLPECDSLAVGKKADIVMIDLMQPNMQPINNIAKNLVYSGSKMNVKMTMVDGKILYEDGVFHIGTPASDIYKEANRLMDEIRPR